MDGTTTTNTMASLIENFTPMVTSIFGWIETICETIVSQPFLLLTVGFLVVGGAVGIFGRLLSRS